MSSSTCVVRQPSAQEAARLLLHLHYRRSEDVERETTRFRVSLETLRELAARATLRPAFLDALDDALRDAGWIGVVDGDYFCVLKRAVTADWPRIAHHRIQDVLARARNPTVPFDVMALPIADPLQTPKKSRSPDPLGGGF
jgi:hypothetical protein